VPQGQMFMPAGPGVPGVPGMSWCVSKIISDY
jgi:hypothetical protein